MKNSYFEETFLSLLKKEVVPAIGCTEPISIALASAFARKELHGEIQKIDAKVSKNLMKNALGVTVPKTGEKGLLIACAVGAIGGDASFGLEVLKNLQEEDVKRAKDMMAANKIHLTTIDTSHVLYVETVLTDGKDTVKAIIEDEHTNLVLLEKNDKVIFQKTKNASSEEKDVRTLFSTAKYLDIYDFCQNIALEKIAFMNEAKNLNYPLSLEGLKKDYGLKIGVSLQKQLEKGLLTDDLFTKIMIKSAAASDARMGGSAMPAMTNSGSGNQGITATIPVVVVSKELHANYEQSLRALTLSHLTAIYIHSFLPKLSAFCAVTSAAMGAAAGMTYLLKNDFETISLAINNMVGDLVGMICDGASNSCALKVSSATSSACKAVLLALENSHTNKYDGIVHEDIDASMMALGKIAAKMQQTDDEVLDIMLKKHAD